MFLGKKSPSILNNRNVPRTFSEKHRRVIVGQWLVSEDNFRVALCNINASIGLSRKLQNLLLRNAIITLYKPFFRQHPVYVDISYGHSIALCIKYITQNLNTSNVIFALQLGEIQKVLRNTNFIQHKVINPSVFLLILETTLSVQNI